MDSNKKERPILFSGAMVRALLAGTKTQTRRVVKITHRTPGLAACLQPADPTWARPKAAAELCPYGRPGDHLWVRETFMRIDGQTQPWIETDYRATYTHGDRLGDTLGIKKRWSPAIHMPRHASRITLEVVSVRVERLQDCSEADALAEGCTADTSWSTPWWQGYRDDGEGYLIHQQWQGDEPPDWMVEPKPMRPLDHLNRSARDNYRTLWIGLNGLESWDANPWVWVLEFKRVEATQGARAAAEAVPA